jgi:hypothetical protein
MVLIRFSDPEVEKKALGFLIGRFNFKTWADGHTAIPERALAALASEGFSFIVEGLATYEQSSSPVRNPSAA